MPGGKTCSWLFTRSQDSVTKHVLLSALVLLHLDTVLPVAFVRCLYLSVKFRELYVEEKSFGLLKLIPRQHMVQETLCNRLRISQTLYLETSG